MYLLAKDIEKERRSSGVFRDHPAALVVGRPAYILLGPYGKQIGWSGGGGGWKWHCPALTLIVGPVTGDLPDPEQ